MPPSTQTRIDQLKLVEPPAFEGQDPAAVQHAAGVSSILFTSFRPISWLPLRQTWIARIVEFEWNHHFVDIQQKGPFKRWRHRHEFQPHVRDGIEGTLVRDIVEYEVGFGPLGALANSLFIAHQMRETFLARQDILPKLLS